MLRNERSVRGWHLQVFLRAPSKALIETLSKPLGRAGIYFIGCADEIVYIGQSINLNTRPIESLGRCYHQVPDASLPWSIAFAVCHPDLMNESESSAIRRYAPKFNTSIPNMSLSECRVPNMTAMAPVFKNQVQTCAAFEPENLLRQTAKAHANPSPPWKRKPTRRKTASNPRPGIRVKREQPTAEFREQETIRRSFAVPRDRLLPFKINLCDGNYVITKDGVIVGTWIEGESRQIFFRPNDATEPLFGDDNMGQFCERIRQWYELTTGDII